MMRLRLAGWLAALRGDVDAAGLLGCLLYLYVRAMIEGLAYRSFQFAYSHVF